MFCIEAEAKVLGLLEGEKETARKSSTSVCERQCSSRLKDAFLAPCGPQVGTVGRQTDVQSEPRKGECEQLKKDLVIFF